MTFTPTAEQQAAIDMARNSTANFQIQALAGAAKTSTLVLMAEAMPTTAILCLAFNKKIAVEMQERLPSNCEAMTLNSLGHRAWGAFLGKRLRLERGKTYNILKAIVNDLPRGEQEDASTQFANYIKAIGHGKANGWVPDGTHPMATRLMDDHEFFASLDEEPTELDQIILLRAMRESNNQMMEGVIDFDDQVYSSALWPVTLPNYPCVMVDEAQDLSPLNHQTLKKLARKRLIAVGDPCQAIYGFRGALESSMEELRQEFDMEVLTLSTSFRCPVAVVEEARWRAPHMNAPEWAKQGEVAHWTEWSAEHLPDDAVILCRNNAPIFSMAINLFANGRYCEIVGNDIGKYLTKTFKELSKNGDNPDCETMLDRIDLWEANKLTKSRTPGRIRDLAACMRVFVPHGENLSQVIAYAEHIMTMSGPVKMMTGHKSKGLEFNNVFILDRQLCRIKDDNSQDRNLLYVMQTRSQDKLTYITTEDFKSLAPTQE